MKICLNEEGYVVSYAIIGDFVESIEVSDPEDEEWFAKHFEEFKYMDGELIRDADREAELMRRRTVEELRLRRSKECFPVINRGAIWYSHLTGDQKAELDKWYEAWLNVTETLKVPEPPTWI